MRGHHYRDCPEIFRYVQSMLSVLLGFRGHSQLGASSRRVSRLLAGNGSRLPPSLQALRVALILCRTAEGHGNTSPSSDQNRGAAPVRAREVVRVVAARAPRPDNVPTPCRSSAPSLVRPEGAAGSARAREPRSHEL